MNILIDMPPLPAGMAALAAIEGLRISVVQPNDEAPRELPVELIRSAELLFCTYPPSNLQDMPDLSFIQIASSGFSQLIELNLPSRGIRAANASGVFDTAIAEWI
nr:hypothetical protein [Pirellulales bacterium]